MVQLHHGARDRQSEPEARHPVALPGVRLLKGPENAIGGFRGKPDAVVADPDSDARLASGQVMGGDVDVAAAARELHRVAQQIPEDLLQPRGIATHDAAGGGQVRGGFNAFPQRLVLHDGQGQAQDIVQFAGLGAQRELVAAQSREVQEVIDEPGFEGDVALNHRESFPDLCRERLVLAQGRGGHQHRGERRAQFMRKLRQEVVLRLDRGLQRLLAAAELLTLAFHAIERVAIAPLRPQERAADGEHEDAEHEKAEQERGNNQGADASQHRAALLQQLLLAVLHGADVAPDGIHERPPAEMRRDVRGLPRPVRAKDAQRERLPLLRVSRQHSPFPDLRRIVRDQVSQGLDLARESLQGAFKGLQRDGFARQRVAADADADVEDALLQPGEGGQHLVGVINSRGRVQEVIHQRDQHQERRAQGCEGPDQRLAHHLAE